MDQVIQIAGALLILAVLAFTSSQWGFVLLETVWAIVSAWGLTATLRAPGRSRQG